MRIAAPWVLIALAGCEPALAPRSLPTLVEPARAAAAVEPTGFWLAGERMVWRVRWRGVAVGSAETTVYGDPLDRGRVVTRFTPESIAKLTTSAVVDSSASKPSGAVHTLHSALAWLRDWCARARGPAVLRLGYDGRQYLVRLGTPARELGGDDVVLVHVRAQPVGRASASGSIDLRLWITTDARRTIRRAVIERGKESLLVTLTSHES